jgi:hypothetical protein
MRSGLRLSWMRDSLCWGRMRRRRWLAGSCTGLLHGCLLCRSDEAPEMIYDVKSIKPGLPQHCIQDLPERLLLGVVQR